MVRQLAGATGWASQCKQGAAAIVGVDRQGHQDQRRVGADEGQRYYREVGRGARPSGLALRTTTRLVAATARDAGSSLPAMLRRSV